jgi:hypothetical protein
MDNPLGNEYRCPYPITPIVTQSHYRPTHNRTSKARPTIPRTLTPQEQTHLQTLHQQFPQAGTAITRATERASDRAMALANRASNSHRATITPKPDRPIIHG